ncbi:hypothetical protein [Flavobacterium sp.]|uniref:hypothetical protein n=1 Tax=Flavobacterium sp. TaxID=239 RepID=UPI000EBEC80A|nr:hypothetical protein [Flavobacterium sp.]HCQ12818.1 hypothetical protein [Flavobacterium sp.]
MKKITFKDYKTAIKKQYEIVKNDDVSGILANPSPAQMRNLSLIILDKGISRKEEELFRLFFGTKENESLKKSIENCNVDKFRPVISFLKDETDSENSIRIEMSALLIDFKPRPYSVFSNSDDLELVVAASDNQKMSNIIIELDVSESSSDLIKINAIESNNRFPKKKIAIGLFSLIGVFSIAYTSKDMIFPNKECMEWKEDHYEMIDCKSEQVGFANTKIIKPFDEIEFGRKELTVCDTTTFFNGKKAIVWYSKRDKIIQFFNMDGENPENDAEIKKVTPHIIEEYVLACE